MNARKIESSIGEIRGPPFHISDEEKQKEW